MSISCQMDKQNVAHLYNKIIFYNKKELSTDTFLNVNEPLKHYAKWKPVIKDPILDDPIHRKCPGQGNLIAIESSCIGLEQG